MIPVVVAFTPNYIVPVAVTLRSLLDSSGGEFLVICLVTEQPSEAVIRKLEKMGGGRVKIEYVNLSGRLNGVYTSPRYSEAASFRLLLPELLPEYDRVIYLDCDIVVRQDISRLLEAVNLGDNYLAAVYEAPIENQAERFKALGCSPKEYFNSGFLVMNLALMRKDKICERLLDACRVDWLEFPDQDALNMVCQGRVTPLSPVYNAIRTFFLPQYKSEFLAQYGSWELWEEVQHNGTIHYTGGKPWNLFTVKFGEWWRVYDTLPREIKEEWTPNPGIYRLWRIYRTKLGHRCVDALQSIYRRIKK